MRGERRGEERERKGGEPGSRTCKVVQASIMLPAS